MSHPALLKDKRFSAFFIAQFLGVVNDNMFKTALVVMLAYDKIESPWLSAPIMVSLAAALFILPFILLAPLSGQLADTYSKTKLTIIIKAAEILIAIGGAITLLTGSPIGALIILATLGAQSAFFVPCKYGLPPELLERHELMRANGLLSGGTYIAVLIGTMIGALLGAKSHGPEILSALLLFTALIGYLTARKIPETNYKPEERRIAKNPIHQIKDVWDGIRSQRGVLFPSILATAWFYFIAATFHAQFPNYASDTLHVSSNTLAFFMLIFSFGIGAGSIANAKILQNTITARFVPYAIGAIGILTLILYGLSTISEPPQDHRGLIEFLSHTQGIALSLTLAALSFAGGLYIVPLRARIQSLSRHENRARVLAGGSMFDAIMIFLSAILAALLLAAGLQVIDLFLLLGLATLASTLYFRILK